LSIKAELALVKSHATGFYNRQIAAVPGVF